MLCSAWDAVWKSHGDAGTMTFVLSSLVTVALLQWCMHRYGRIPEERHREKDMTRASVFALAMVLNVLVCWRVTGLLRLHSIPLAVLAASTAFSGAYLIFFFFEDKRDPADPIHWGLFGSSKWNYIRHGIKWAETGTLAGKFLPLLCILSILPLYGDLVKVLKGHNTVVSIFSSMGSSLDVLLLCCYISAVKSGALKHIPNLASGTRTLLLTMISYRATLMASPHDIAVWVILGFALLATVSLYIVSGLPLPCPARLPRPAVSQNLFWRVLRSLTFFLVHVDLLTYMWDGVHVLKKVTMTCGIVIDLLLVQIYAAAMSGGALEGAPLGGGAIVSLALSYRTTVLISPPPFWVVALFAVMMGNCFMAT